ncbi:PTS galactitol transporter subunit IIC [Pilibacter termitis]|uniref:PTS galactitol transporter subunit IIC n=1 Tax=Pilibacter termitis TaxID=263852 RepID=UPI00099A8D37|nr:PTS transporter subunit IIC [Pilibacter termitis]
MKTVNDVVQYVLGLGPSVMLPIMIFIIALIFRVKIGEAIRSGITIGIAMIGVNLVIGVLSDNIGPAAQEMVKRFGLNLTIVDAGWPAAAAAAWAAPVAALIIPICLVVNLLLVVIKFTKTVDIDIWNYWHFVASASTAYVVTGGNWGISIIAAIINEVIVLKIADKTAPIVSEFYGLEGITLPTTSTDAYGLLGIPIGYGISKIPGLNKINISSDTIQKRFGIFGEPMMMGVFIGILLGVLAGYDVGKVCQLAMSLGAVMFLMPRMVKILMEGLVPISEAAKEFLSTRFKGREIYLGLDAALTTGHPANLATGLLLVPITLLVAVILPGNKVLPFGDLATIPFYVSLIVGSRKGNIFHSVLTGTVVIAIGLLLATNFAPVHTQMMEGVGNKLVEQGTTISSLDVGGNVIHWVILKLSELYQSIAG